MSSERRDWRWIRKLNDLLHATPTPTTIEDAVAPLVQVGVIIRGPAGLFDLPEGINAKRSSWANHVAAGAGPMHYLRSLGLGPGAYAATLRLCEDFAMSIYLYTLEIRDGTSV